MRRSILLLGNYPPPYGGVPVHLEYLASYLADRQWDVHILQTKIKAETIRQIGSITIHNQSPVIGRAQWPLLARNWQLSLEHKSLLFDNWDKFVRCLNLAERAREIVRKHKIQVISAYHIFPQGLVGAWLSQEYSIPLVTTIFGEIYTELDFYRRIKKEANQVFTSSRRLISCSLHCAKSPELLNIHADVEPVYYGIDVDEFSPNIDQMIVRRRLGISKSDPVVIFVGRLTEEMGVMALLNSIPLVLKEKHNTRFILVGAKANLLDVVLGWRERYSQNLFVVPDVPRADLPLYYASATIAVVPSINDRACLGLAAAEAMASGKPVIITNIGGGAEVVIPDQTGALIPPNDPVKLAEAVLALIENKAALQRMGLSGRQRAEESFDQYKTNQRMEQILQHVME